MLRNSNAIRTFSMEVFKEYPNIEKNEENIKVQRRIKESSQK